MRPDGIISFSMLQGGTHIRQQGGKTRLAFDQRPGADVLAVEIQEIEQEEHQRRSVAAIRRGLDTMTRPGTATRFTRKPASSRSIGARIVRHARSITFQMTEVMCRVVCSRPFWAPWRRLVSCRRPDAEHALHAWHDSLPAGDMRGYTGFPVGMFTTGLPSSRWKGSGRFFVDQTTFATRPDQRDLAS